MTEPVLVMGEVTALGSVREPLDCAIPGVVAQQQSRGKGRLRVEERLYECPNGLALAARRGGPLHLADSHTWEVMLLTEFRSTAWPQPEGWVTEDTLSRMVANLAEWQREASA